jgi:hypothetical protein
MQDSLDNRNAAKSLGYYLFWYLRKTPFGLTLSQEEVTERAKLAGIKHTDTAWNLLDRNGDDTVTLEVSGLVRSLDGRSLACSADKLTVPSS